MNRKTKIYVILKIELGDERNCSGAISVPSATEGLVSKALPITSYGGHSKYKVRCDDKYGDWLRSCLSIDVMWKLMYHDSDQCVRAD